MTDRVVTRGEAHDALAFLAARQRSLRTAYATARYWWPEAPATAWRDRPATFADGVPPCRVTLTLEALSSEG